jgi:prolyl oligopeptidase
MSGLACAPPFSPVEPVTEVFHGVPVTDPYRWLEDQGSPRTREWLKEQTRYARAHLDNIPGRELIQKRTQEFLAVETCDSVQKAGCRYFFRKRLPNQEQPCIYMREGIDGYDQLLIDPAEYGRGKYTSVKLLRVSPGGRLVLYEVKQGGERTGTFELLETETRTRLPDVLPRGLLRGLVFAPDGGSFYYSHEASETTRPSYRAVCCHILGTPFSDDQEIFYGGDDKRLRLFILGGNQRLGILINKCLDRVYTDFYLRPYGTDAVAAPVLVNADFVFEPILAEDRILALTDRGAPNLRIVEILAGTNNDPEFIEIIPEQDVPIHQWSVVGESLFATYVRQGRTEIHPYDFAGRRTEDVPVPEVENIRFVGPLLSQELIFEAESLTEPIAIWRYPPQGEKCTLLAKRNVPFDSENYDQSRIWYPSKDGTRVPMFLVGRRDVLNGGAQPTILTSYGGFGASITAQFSVFVASLLERGCLFALACIRGGGDFGAEWHSAGKRRNRQTAIDDFLSAAEWLIKTGRTAPGRLAIFGGSNAGLLVGAALTQKPHLFRAVLCIAPMLDMLRYHLFDESHIWKEEFGTADDAEDFAGLAKYSPYQQVRQGLDYPATLIVSGDVDTNCNPLHARKMTARLQAANSSPHPILLDYSELRGHSLVLPLSERIRGLTDRVALFCDQLQLTI